MEINKYTLLSYYNKMLDFLAIPSWINPRKDMVDAIILEGESITITCKARGVPRPSIKWYYNGIPVQSNNVIIVQI